MDDYCQSQINREQNIGPKIDTSHSSFVCEENMETIEIEDEITSERAEEYRYEFYSDNESEPPVIEDKNYIETIDIVDETSSDSSEDQEDAGERCDTGPPSTVLNEKEFQEKVFVSLGNTPADFKLLTRLLGPDNRNIEFLHIQTNARVELRGKGSLKLSTEPLHFLVKHKSYQRVQEAVLLVQFLIDTVQQEFEQYCTENQGNDSPADAPRIKMAELNPSNVGGIYTPMPYAPPEVDAIYTSTPDAGNVYISTPAVSCDVGGIYTPSSHVPPEVDVIFTSTPPDAGLSPIAPLIETCAPLNNLIILTPARDQRTEMVQKHSTLMRQRAVPNPRCSIQNNLIVLTPAENDKPKSVKKVADKKVADNKLIVLTPTEHDKPKSAKRVEEEKVADNKLIVLTPTEDDKLKSAKRVEEEKVADNKLIVLTPTEDAKPKSVKKVADEKVADNKLIVLTPTEDDKSKSVKKVADEKVVNNKLIVLTPTEDDKPKLVKEVQKEKVADNKLIVLTPTEDDKPKSVKKVEEEKMAYNKIIVLTPTEDAKPKSVKKVEEEKLADNKLIMLTPTEDAKPKSVKKVEEEKVADNKLIVLTPTEDDKPKSVKNVEEEKVADKPCKKQVKHSVMQKKAGASKESREASIKKRTDLIVSSITGLKKEVEKLINKLPPGYLRNKFLKISQLSDAVEPASHSTHLHNQLSSLVDHLSKLYFNPNTEGLDDIKPMYLNLQQALNELTFSTVQQESTTESSSEGYKQLQQLSFRTEQIATLREHQAGLLKNDQGNIINKTNETQNTASLAKQQNSKGELFNKQTEEKSNNVITPNRQHPIKRKPNFPQRMFQKRMMFQGPPFPNPKVVLKTSKPPVKPGFDIFKALQVINPKPPKKTPTGKLTKGQRKQIRKLTAAGVPWEEAKKQVLPSQSQLKGSKQNLSGPSNQRSLAGKPGCSAVKPSSPAVKPSSPAVKLSSPAVKPSSSAVKPVSPAVKSSCPAVKPSSSAVRPSSPAVKPSNTAVKSSCPAVKPSSSAVKFSSPAVKPSSSAVKPISSAVKPKSPAVNPQSSKMKPSSSALKQRGASNKGLIKTITKAVKRKSHQVTQVSLKAKRPSKRKNTPDPLNMWQSCVGFNGNYRVEDPQTAQNDYYSSQNFHSRRYDESTPYHLEANVLQQYANLSNNIQQYYDLVKDSERLHSGNGTCITGHSEVYSGRDIYSNCKRLHEDHHSFDDFDGRSLVSRETVFRHRQYYARRNYFEDFIDLTSGQEETPLPSASKKKKTSFNRKQKYFRS